MEPGLDEDEDEVLDFAARVQVPVLADGKPVGREIRLFVVAASSPNDARRASGLVDAHFEPATDEDLAEWEAATDEDLTDFELERLLRLVRRELVQVANKEARNAQFGRSRGYRRRVTDRVKAVNLLVLAGKLEAMLADDISDDEDEDEDD